MNNIQLLIGKGSKFYDYTNLISKITWSGRKGAAPRNLTAVLADSEGYSQGRASVNCGDGQLAIFKTGGKERFRGLIMSDTYGSSRQLTIKAYDMCVYLANNKDSFSFKKKRADQIFRKCCKKLKLKVGTATNTKYKIPELVKKGTTAWDVIQDALSQTYRATGRRYYVYAQGNKLYLSRRKANSKAIVFDPASNIESYERTRSIENTKTRVKMVTSEGKTKKTWRNKALEKKIGRFQEYVSVDEKATATQLKKQVKVFKADQSVVSQTMKITGPGDITLKAGSCVYVKIPHIKTERILYIDEDTHTFENGSHKMTLKLTYAKSIDAAG